MHLKLHALHKRQWIANVTTLRAELREMWWMHRCRVMDDMPWQKQKPVTWHTISIHTVPRTLPLWPALSHAPSLAGSLSHALWPALSHALFWRNAILLLIAKQMSRYTLVHAQQMLNIIEYFSRLFLFAQTHRPYHFPKHFTHFPSRLSGHVLFNPPFDTEYFTNFSSFHCLCFDAKSLSHLFLLCSVRLSLSFAPFLILKTWKCSYC